jgi:Zn-dependent M28 family amino/carboxypeptidase
MAEDWIAGQFEAAGLETEVVPVPVCIPNEVRLPAKLKRAELKAANVVGEWKGTDPRAGMIIIGAHYDSVAFSLDWEGYDLEKIHPERPGTPGANDNASGVAALLAIARHLGQQTPLARTVRLVAFANEEPPFYQQPTAMGSYLYALEHKRENISVMVSLETMAVYTPEEDHAKRGGMLKDFFLWLVGLDRSTDYVAFLNHACTGSDPHAREWAREFTRHSATIDVHTVAVPSLPSGPKGIAWSDDWSFTQNGIPAFCVTDTAYLRSDRYHAAADHPKNLTEVDYQHFAAVVHALQQTVVAMAGRTAPAHP